IFLICTFTGNLLYNKGAFYVWNVLKEREYYRLLSAAFLQFDIEHLFNNMILLFFIGNSKHRRCFMLITPCEASNASGAWGTQNLKPRRGKDSFPPRLPRGAMERDLSQSPRKTESSPLIIPSVLIV
ncbi:MAG: rhomboid family intramembrane serine protease, partial [Opitutales bacterium]|nr:rhomboid family intramembrane serine protease [Opitutales bacterium]